MDGRDYANALRVRLPSFLIEQDIGLGDLIKRTVSTFGILPCGGCLRRAHALNRRITFSPSKTWEGGESDGFVGDATRIF